MVAQPPLSRRAFLRAAAASAAAAVPIVAPGARAKPRGQFAGRIRKAVQYHMVREKLSVLDKFKLLKDLGFDGIEPHVRDKATAKELLAARDATGLVIHGVRNGSTSNLNAAINRAKLLGGDSVLVVAGGVNQRCSYARNYQSTQETLRRAIPHAEKNRVRLLVENAWNNFLLSPLEMARYIDELRSPWAGVCLDVGNVVRYGWPDQWLRILGRRVVKLDIKEYSRTKHRDEGLWKGLDVEIGEGDCDWPAVRKALAATAFRGWATAAVPGGDRRRLQDIAERMSRVLDL